MHACDRFDQYVFGREITVETDHKPLEVILRKPLFAAPKRLQRMMMQLQKYNLKVVYKRGTELYIADTLSRAYLSAPNQVDEEEQEFIRAVENVNMTKHLSISPERLQEFQEKTRDDATLQDLKKNIENGWPDQRNKVLPRTRAYYKFRDELSVQDGILFKSERVIVPISMRAQMLEKIHSSHIGSEGCLRRAREVIFWPGMTAEIKEYVSRCDTCNAHRQDQPKEPLISQPVPERPWVRVAVDLFTLEKKDYIIMVDDYSNYFEVNVLNQTTTTPIITSMKSQFARHGIPEEVRSDNGPQFSSTSSIFNFQFSIFNSQFSIAWSRKRWRRHSRSKPTYSRPKVDSFRVDAWANSQLLPRHRTKFNRKEFNVYKSNLAGNSCTLRISINRGSFP